MKMKELLKKICFGNTKEDEERKKIQVISHLLLRTYIGAIGILLPVIIVIVDISNNKAFLIQDSISDYYQTSARVVFVGALFVLGFFLLAYRGYTLFDRIIASIAGVFALGVAVFPSHYSVRIVENIHFISAVLLFLVFVYFSMCIFRRGKDRSLRSVQKNRRNRIYFFCGIAILICLGGCGLAFCFLTEEQRSLCKIIFIFETLVLWAFGISWLTKGKLLWQMLRFHYLQKPK